jgi:hypothetical protein
MSQWNTLQHTSNNRSLNIDTTMHSTISVNGQNDTMTILDNFTTLSSHETFTSLRAKYIVTTFNAKIENYSYSNIQIFNIILVNVHDSPSNIFRFNVNFLSHNNSWWFQYWHIESKLNITKQTSRFYGPILNGTSI